MAELKGIIFSIIDVLLTTDGNTSALEDLDRLVKMLRTHGVRPAVLSNNEYYFLGKDGNPDKSRPVRKVLEERWGKFDWFTWGQDNVPVKQSAAALPHVLGKMGLEINEAVYLGNSEADMQSAVNGGMLFLNACWYKKCHSYGFQFKSPKELAQFFDVFCFRKHWWHYKIDDGPLKVFALAPYGTKDEVYSFYTRDMLDTAKADAGHEDFWAKYLCTSMYFSGLYKEISYICGFPGHSKGLAKPLLASQMTTFAKCFRGKYLPDLLIRHTESMKSAYNRDKVDHLNQLNTIYLNQLPEKKPGEPYSHPPIGKGKTVLVLDDVCTKGLSFEAARLYIERTGASVICVAWLKAMYRDYERLRSIKFNSYKPTKFTTYSIEKSYPYKSQIFDEIAPEELDKQFRKYLKWDWPK